LHLAARARFLAFARPDGSLRRGEYERQSSSLRPRYFTGIWNPAPFMQPKGEVHPLDLGGQSNPLPPFLLRLSEIYSNAKFIAAGRRNRLAILWLCLAIFYTAPFEILVTRDRTVGSISVLRQWRRIWTERAGFDRLWMPDTWCIRMAVGMELFVVDSADYNGRRSSTWQVFPISESLHADGAAAP